LKYPDKFALSDLVGFPFCWRGHDPLKGMDCYTFASYVRRVLTGVSIKHIPEAYLDMSPNHQGVQVIHNNFLEYLGCPSVKPKHMAICLVGSDSREGIATLLDWKGDYYVAMMSHTQSTVVKLSRLSRLIRPLFWEIPDHMLEVVSK
jgi:hypothetical protein